MPFPAFWDHKWTQTLLKVEVILCIATRTFHKLLEISKKFLLISQKVAQKLLEKYKSFYAWCQNVQIVKLCNFAA